MLEIKLSTQFSYVDCHEQPCYHSHLNGMAFINMSIGLGPVVYLLIIRGSMICMGIMGTPNKASFSFGTPSSINFRPVIASAAAKPI